MSDAYRKDIHTSELSLFITPPQREQSLTFSIEIGEKITPNSTKSTQEKLKESVTDTADRIARCTSVNVLHFSSQLILTLVELNPIPANPPRSLFSTKVSVALTGMFMEALQRACTLLVQASESQG